MLLCSAMESHLFIPSGAFDADIEGSCNNRRDLRTFDAFDADIEGSCNNRRDLKTFDMLY